MRKEGTIKFFETERFNRVYELAIIELPEMYEAWLTRKGYGVAEFLIGCKKEQTIYGKPHTLSWDEFADIAIDYADERMEDASKLVHIDDDDE